MPSLPVKTASPTAESSSASIFFADWEVALLLAILTRKLSVLDELFESVTSIITLSSELSLSDAVPSSIAELSSFVVADESELFAIAIFDVSLSAVSTESADLPAEHPLSTSAASINPIGILQNFFMAKPLPLLNI